MSRPLQFLKSALVTGLVIVLPAWLAVLLLLKLLVHLGMLMKCISKWGAGSSVLVTALATKQKAIP